MPQVATPNDDIALIGDADEITVDMLKQLEAADEYQVQAAANKPVAQFITNLLPGVQLKSVNRYNASTFKYIRATREVVPQS